MSDQGALFELTFGTPPTEEQLREAKRLRSIDKRIGSMHRKFGTTPDQRCGACTHLVRREMAGTYFKCSLYGDTHGPATDWRLRWPACGRFVHNNDGGDQ